MNYARSLRIIAAAGAFAFGSQLAMTTAAFAQQSTWERVKESGTVRVGIITNRACYYWRNSEEEEWKGFPVNFAKAAVDALEEEMETELTIEWVPTNWSTVVLDLQSSNVDMFLGLGETEERKQAVNMFGPLYAVPEVLLVREDYDGGSSWDDINNPETRIAVTMGSTEETAARENAPNADIRAMQTNDLSILAVQSGSADLQIDTVITVLNAVTRGQNLKMLLLDPYTAIPAGGAVRKDSDGKMSDFLQEWSQEYRSSGGVQEAIMLALDECGLDTDQLPEGTIF